MQHESRVPPALRVSLVLLACLALPACDEAAGSAKGGGRGDRTPTVAVGTVAAKPVVDEIEAVGNALAYEQATITSPVTERIERLNVRDGGFVQRGAVIAVLAQAEEGASLQQAGARLREAEQQLERLQALQSRGFATNQRVEEQEALVASARAQAGVVRAQIGDRVIRAPFSGWMSLRRISQGTVVSSGTPIATIVDYSRIKLDFPIPETFLATIGNGQRIVARAAAFPGETFTGTVSSIDPIVDPATRSVTVRAVLPNGSLRLRPGMMMTVALKSPPRQALMVPELALVGQGAQSFVFRVRPDSSAERVVVETGTRRDGLVEVRRGLAAGETIIVDGTVKARDGGKVRPVPVGSPDLRAA